MNIYELIKTNQSVLNVLKENGVTVNDVNNLAIYEEFLEMKSHGHKTVYCATVIADKYGKSLRLVYNIIKHFRKSVVL